MLASRHVAQLFPIMKTISRSRVLVIALAAGSMLTFTSSPACAAPGTKSTASKPAELPKAKLTVDTGIFQPGSVASIEFPFPMATAARLSQPLAEGRVTIDPPFAGVWKWNTPTEAKFYPEEAGTPGRMYKVSITGDMTSPDGKKVAPGQVGTIQTAPFVLERVERENYYGGRSIDREPRCYLWFTDAVEPSATKGKLEFRDFAGRIIPAKVRMATRAEQSRFYSVPRSWTERYNDLQKTPEAATPVTTGSVDMNAAVPHVLLVEAASLLPEGKDWRLVVKSGISGLTGSTPTPEAKESGKWTIAPLVFVDSSAGTNAEKNQPEKRIFLNFNKTLKKEGVESFIKISPEVPGLEMDTTYNGVSLTGSFQNEVNYRVVIAPGVAAGDGITMGYESVTWARFEALTPFVQIPTQDVAQFNVGRRQYAVHSVNMGSVRLRVRALGSGELARTLQAFDNYTGRVRTGSEIRTKSPLPMELVPGTDVFDKTFNYSEAPWDTVQTAAIDWTELLGNRKPTALFVSVESRARKDFSSWEKREKEDISQTVIQLTDIGVTWKRDAAGWLLYAFSCETGEPMDAVEIKITDADGKLLATHRTASDGTCRLPDYGKVFTVEARKGDDLYAFIADENLQRTPMYRFPIETADEPQKEPMNDVFIFTDRQIYRPGETAHFKGIWRHRLDTTLTVPPEREVDFSIRDESDREIFRKKVSVTENGTFTETVEMPMDNVGEYRVVVDLPKPETSGTTVNESEEESDGEYDNAFTQHYTFSHNFFVQEFRRSAFEIKLETPQPQPNAAEIPLAFRANYLMGKPLSLATAQWFSRIAPAGFYPENYQGYLFGDHAKYNPYYWYRYFGFRDSEFDEDAVDRNAETDEGKLELGADGTAAVNVPLPKFEFPGPLAVEVRAEITDVNQQTLAETKRYEIPGSKFYLGAERVDRLVRVGSETPVNLVAVSADGTPFTKSVNATVTIEREAWTTTATQSGSGDRSAQNTKSIVPVLAKDVTLQGAPAGAAGVIAFTPTDTGTHLVTIRSTDENGSPVATRIRLEAYGSDYGWAYEEGARVRLVPDKKEYAPGETAKLLVMTPIDGTALVTVERRNIQRHFVTKLSSASPLLEIPVTEEDAPNVFVTVSLIKGLKDNQREIKEPVLKLGICQLRVSDAKNGLTVKFAPTRDTVRPGEESVIEGAIFDAIGKPVQNAEVTLWAVDEGVLQVVGYENPNPLRALMPRQPLSVTMGSTLPYFLSENPGALDFVSKGFMAGGGGDFSALGKLRKDFNPCPLWLGALTTDAQGLFRARFNTPDTLTRYRVLAVALSGAAKFGAGTSALTVNKPIMIEPVTPRVAAVGDKLRPKAVVHNMSQVGGQFEVSLKTGAESKIGGTGPSQRIEIAPGESKAVVFDVEMTDVGEAVWNWSAKPVSLAPGAPANAKKELVDAVQSKFPVNYPLPLFRQTGFERISATSRDANLFAKLDPALIARGADVIIECSYSRLNDAAAAVEQVLHYPYGCVEQTTSSLMPWFAVRELRDAIPALKKTDAEIAKALDSGAKRLLSMQTESGGLSYWPGDREPVLWGSTYGGMGLILAKREGAPVPDDAIKQLLDYLSSNLAETKSPAERIRILHTLAMGGRADVAAMEQLAASPAALDPSARAVLALAFLEAGEKDAARAILTSNVTTKSNEPWLSFLERRLDVPLALLAWCKIDPTNKQVDSLVDQLLALRDRQGHWNSTLNNAWGLAALAAYATAVEGKATFAEMEISGAGLSEKIQLSNDKKSWQKSIRLSGTDPIIAKLTNDGRAFFRISIASRPPIAPAKEFDNGFSIQRSYFRVTADGKTEPLVDPVIGDLILVQLQFNARNRFEYVAIDDPLPASLEAVNPEFSEDAAGRANLLTTNWIADRTEYRDDRVVFFRNYYNSGKGEARYFARVTGVGDVAAPPARIEAMYAPDRHGLSATSRIETK